MGSVRMEQGGGGDGSEVLGCRCHPPNSNPPKISYILLLSSPNSNHPYSVKPKLDQTLTPAPDVLLPPDPVAFPTKVCLTPIFR